MRFISLKLNRPAVLRFRSTIKLYLAFYSIGMYKGGWTDYFLAPALDCRESRTHFLYTRAYSRRESSSSLYVSTCRCIFFTGRTGTFIIIKVCFAVSTIFFSNLRERFYRVYSKWLGNFLSSCQFLIYTPTYAFSENSFGKFFFITTKITIKMWIIIGNLWFEISSLGRLRDIMHLHTCYNFPILYIMSATNDQPRDSALFVFAHRAYNSPMLCMKHYNANWRSFRATASC